jgi:membrane protein DedA with SNARE-associated domain
MERERPSRKRLWLVLGPLIVLVVAAQIGDAFAPTLAVEHPLALISLNARNRNLILTTNSLDALSFYGVAFVRLLVSDPLFYILGLWYGDAGVSWVEKRSSSFGGMLRSWEYLFKKAAWPLVAIAPNNFICLFAGAAGMSVTGFFVTNIAGTLVRLYLIRRLGEAFEAPIDDVLSFIARYRVPLLVLSVVVFAFVMVNELRQTKEEVEAIEEAAADPEPDPPLS